MVDVLEVSLGNFLIFRVGIGPELALLCLVEVFERLDGIFILSRTLSTQCRTEQSFTPSILLKPLGYGDGRCEYSKAVGVGLTRYGDLAAFRGLFAECTLSLEEGNRLTLQLDTIKE